MEKYLKDNEMLFSLQTIKLIDILHRFKLLTSENLQTIKEILADDSEKFMLAIMAFEHDNILTTTNIKLILENAEHIISNARYYDDFQQYGNLLTNDILEITIQYPDIIRGTNKATDMLITQGILSANSLKLIYSIYAQYNDNVDEAVEKTKSAASLLIEIHQANLSLTDETIIYNNLDKAGIIMKDMLNLKNLLSEFLELNIKKTSNNLFNSTIKSHEIVLANKVLSALNRENKSIVFDDSDRKVLRDSKRLLKIINQCEIIPALLNLNENLDEKQPDKSLVSDSSMQNK